MKALIIPPSCALAIALDFERGGLHYGSADSKLAEPKMLRIEKFPIAGRVLEEREGAGLRCELELR